jgi:hypothetical protein
MAAWRHDPDNVPLNTAALERASELAQLSGTHLDYALDDDDIEHEKNRDQRR